MTKPRAMAMRLSGADGRSPPFTRPSRSSGPLGTVSVKQRTSARGCVSFQRGEHLLSGTPEHTFPRCGRVPLKPLHDDQGLGGRPLSATVGHVGRIASRPILPSGAS